MSKPNAKDRGVYMHPIHGATGFTVCYVEGDLCYAKYDAHSKGDVQPFIWRFPDGLNELHEWPGKPQAAITNKEPA